MFDFQLVIHIVAQQTLRTQSQTRVANRFYNIWHKNVCMTDKVVHGAVNTCIVSEKRKVPITQGTRIYSLQVRDQLRLKLRKKAVNLFGDVRYFHTLE